VLKAYFARLDRFADVFVDHLQNDVVVPPDGGVEAMMREIVEAAEMARRGESNQRDDGNRGPAIQ